MTEFPFRVDEEDLLHIVNRMALPVWTADFAETFSYLDEHGFWEVEDPEAFFDDHPRVLQGCVRRYRILQANEATLNLLEPTGEVDLARVMETVLTDQALVLWTKGLAAVHRGCTEFEWPMELVTLAGNRREILVRWLIPADRRAGRTVVVSSGLDVIRMRVGEEALRDAELKSRLIVESVRAIFWRSSPEGSFHFVSRQAEGILGFPCRRWTSEPTFWRDHLHPEDLDWALEYCTSRTLRGEDHEFEYRMLSADGEVVWLRDLVHVVVADGEPVELVGVILDVTDGKEAEATLAESEERYRRVVEDQTEFIVRHDRDGKFTFANESFCRYFDLTAEEIIGESIYARMSDGEREAIRAKLAALTPESPLAVSEHEVRVGDGSLRRNEWTDRALFAAEGRLLEFQSVGRDITDRRATEDALRKKAAHEAMVLREFPIAFYTARPSEDFGGTWVSDQIGKISGFEPERFTEDPGLWAAMLHPDDRKRVLGEFERLQVGEELHSEYRWRHAEGEYRWILDHAALVEREGGEPPEIVGTWLDITERKSAEEVIRESEEKFSKAFFSSPDAIVISTREEGRILDVNRGFERVFGHGRADSIGRTSSDLGVWEDLSDREEVLAAIRKGAEVRDIELRFRRKSGEKGVCEFSAEPIRIGGRPCLLSVTHDITSRKEAERALRTAYAEVERLKDRLADENVYLRGEIRRDRGFGEIVGESPPVLDLLATIRKVAATDATVLVTGETGTGKELVARALHRMSARRDRALVKVNCSAVSAGLVESELFGHVRGAFTGAHADRKGRFALADGGTIFLDEVGELLPETQVKLLRVLEEREFEPVGSSMPVRVDVRVIAATNRNLELAMEEGGFRFDLFYRLNVFPITATPLRERRADIPLLAEHFLRQVEAQLGRSFRGFDQESLEWMSRYEWPGNVRELRNMVERAAIVATEDLVSFSRWSLATGRVRIPSTSATDLDSVLRNHILDVLQKTNGVIEGPRGAATLVGLAPSTLRSRMKKLGIRWAG